MGFRNPFRIQVDENDVAYVTDYSPDSQTPQRGRGPAGTGRVEIVRKPANYGWPLCYTPEARLLPVELPRVRARHHDGRQPRPRPPQPIRLRQRRRAAQRLALGASTAARARARPALTPAGHRSGHLVLLPRQQRGTAPLGTPCFGYYATTPGPIAPGSTTECPRLFPELLHGRRRRRTARPSTTTTRPTRTPNEVPAVLRQLGHPRRVQPGHAARDQARLAEPHLQDQPVPRLRRRRTSPTAPFAVRVRQPDGHAVRRGRRVLPADLR